MKAIIGEVTAIDARRKNLMVSAVLSGPGGRDKKKKFEVPWSRDTVFMSKGKRKVRSSAAKIKPGMNVIVQLEGPRFPAGVVWHEPTLGPIALTVRECRDLGGEIVADGSCPNVSEAGGNIRQRCKTAGGSSCITKLDP